MMNLRRNRRAAALALAVAGLWTGALAAQDNGTVGNPQLKDFQLPGQRTTPPAQPQPVPPAPAPSTTRTAPLATTRSTTTPPAARTTAPAAAAPGPRPTSRRATEPPVRAPERAEPTATHAPAATPSPAPTTQAPAPVAQAPAPVTQAPTPEAAPPPAAPAPQEGTAAFNLNWLWLVVPVLLGLGALLLFRRRRYAARGEADRDALAGALLPEEAPVPKPVLPLAAEPAPAAPAEEAPRPWLELDIEPDRASATEEAATLHYELVVTNVGDETARNIRIDTRMFNAADEQQIAAFLGGPIHRHSGSPHVTIPPGESMRLGAGIGMKADEVRAIELQGRRIFVPAVAMNVAYDWGENGEGRSSKSWLVGRKPDDPKARMGAFRLDLGPRIYRSVGRRDTKRVMV